VYRNLPAGTTKEGTGFWTV